MASIALLTKRKGDPAIGHLVNGFRNTRSADPKLIAEAFDVLDSRTGIMMKALTTPIEVSGPGGVAFDDTAVTLNNNSVPY